MSHDCSYLSKESLPGYRSIQFIDQCPLGTHLQVNLQVHTQNKTTIVLYGIVYVIRAI